MKKIVRFLKMLFRKYELGYEYWIDLKDIKVPKHYKRYNIKQLKWNSKLAYWIETGEFESTILLRRDFTLVDGYSSYLIANKYDLSIVPVYFVD